MHKGDRRKNIKGRREKYFNIGIYIISKLHERKGNSKRWRKEKGEGNIRIRREKNVNIDIYILLNIMKEQGTVKDTERREKEQWNKKNKN